MTLLQIRSFLKKELAPQIKLEIKPLLYKGQRGGGYFGVTRQILCMVDFLGALYCGYKGEKYPNGSRKISTSTKALRYLKEMMGNNIDSGYRICGDELYAMYRHGLVHLYQPRMIFQKNSRTLKWFAYKGRRSRKKIIANSNIGKRAFHNVRHLKITADPLNIIQDYLPISINCLYTDLLESVDLYYRKLKKQPELQKNWSETANAIIQPEKI